MTASGSLFFRFCDVFDCLLNKFDCFPGSLPLQINADKHNIQIWEIVAAGVDKCTGFDECAGREGKGLTFFTLLVLCYF